MLAIAVAVMLLAGTPGLALAVTLGGLAVWSALRGRAMVALSVPLDRGERAELDRLKSRSRPVRELIAVIEAAGQQPVRFDLLRCRRLARVDALLDGGA